MTRHGHAGQLCTANPNASIVTNLHRENAGLYFWQKANLDRRRAVDEKNLSK
jgi:hypothetical protein